MIFVSLLYVCVVCVSVLEYSKSKNCSYYENWTHFILEALEYIEKDFKGKYIVLTVIQSSVMLNMYSSHMYI